MPQVIIEHAQIDDILGIYRKELGGDFDAYRGHCLRMWNYLQIMGMDNMEQDLVAIALPFHDLSIWVDQSMDYLEPSFQLAFDYISKHQISVDVNELQKVIVLHHQLTPIRDAPLAEKFRKADLIDLTMGLVKGGLIRSQIKNIHQVLPFRGFSAGMMGKVCKYAITHPLNPFPMLKF